MMVLRKALQVICRQFPDVQFAKNTQEATLTCPADCHGQLLHELKNNTETDCKVLIDVCGVDYLHYGQTEWETTTATASGYGRGVESMQPNTEDEQPRFSVVYHLLSMSKKHRVRVKVPVSEQSLQLDSVVDLFPNAAWYEREVYDLFGIHFHNHPDLRRILTDYGFIGHPFRKDFPLEGFVEMRFDAHLKRCVYEPVEIVPRVTVAKVIRDKDNRYGEGQ